MWILVCVTFIKPNHNINKMFPQTEAAAAIDNVGDDVDEEYCSDLDHRLKQFHQYKGGDVADVYYLSGDRFAANYWSRNYS